MNCRLHPTRSAVSTCKKCGGGVCNDCSSIATSVGARQYCVKCAKNEVTDSVVFDNALKSRLNKSIKIMLFTWIIGAILVLVGAIIIAKQQNEVGLLLLLIGIVISGIFTAIDGWKEGERMHEKKESIFGETYTVSGDYIRKDTGFSTKLIQAFFGLVFGVFLTPARIAKYKKMKSEVDEELRKLNPIITKLDEFTKKAR